MKTFHKSALIAALGLSSLAGNSQAGLDINLDFTNFNAGPSGNVNTILNGASISDARGVMEQAAALWEGAFANSDSGLAWAVGGTLTRDITVTWQSHGGSTLATGGGSWFGSGEWAAGSLNWDQDESSSFFVDTSPGDSTEWQQFSSRSQSLGGVSVNIERVSYDAPAGTARSNTDMLTVAFHEIGHALGFLSGTPLYDAADVGGDSDIDITSGAFSGADIPISGGHMNLTIANPGNDSLGAGQSDFPYDPGGGFFSNFDYNPAVMAPSLVGGVRYGLTEADILVVAEFLDYDMATVNLNPVVVAVPEPSSLALLSLSGLLIARRRRA